MNYERALQLWLVRPSFAHDHIPVRILVISAGVILPHKWYPPLFKVTGGHGI